MSDVAIRVDSLSKKYVLGHREPYKTLRESLMSVASAPARWLAPRKEDPEDVLWALKDVAFEVKRGEVVGIIGRNGAGKSTLLKILSRITEPTSGTAEIFGRVGSLLEVGTGFHPELSGRENIFMNGAILGMRRAEIARKFDEIVAFAEVERFIDTPVKRYSSGMYMRLAFAVAAHLEPEILIVDEVLAVGDAEFQKKCLGKMGEVAEGGRTVLFVSHNMSAVRQLCQRGILLASGRLSFSGRTGACVDLYASAGSTGDATILSRLTRSPAFMQITDIRVNGSSQDELHLAAGSRELAVEVRGTLARKTRLDLQATILNHNDVPLGSYSPAHDRGKTETYEPGEFCVRRRVALPRITRGTYYLNLEVTDPGVEGYISILRALRIYAEGAPLATGTTFHHEAGAGWMMLDDIPLESSTNAS